MGRSRGVGPTAGVALLALCLVTLVVAGRVAAHGHIVAAVVIGAVASLAGLAVLLVVPSGGRR